MTSAELDRLREIVGREYVQGEGLAREYAIEGCAPEAVAEPQSIEELCALVRLAGEMDWPIVAWGGATQISMGPPPERYRLAIPSRRMNRVVEYQPEDMTVTVQSGIILDNLARVLNERGQFLPVDPPLPQRATVGGTAAAAASGPLRAAYGTPRDYLLGAAVVGADAKVVHAGGKVVKNVAGYDLCKLYTGSRGTLGVFGELTLKVLPKPRCWAYSGVALRDADRAEELIAAAQGSDLAPVALELVNGAVWETVAGAALAPDRFLLFCAFAGEEEMVAWQQAALETLAAEHGLRAYGLPDLQAEVWFRALRDYPARSGLVARLAARSSDVAALCAAAEGAGRTRETEVGIVAHTSAGVIWARYPDVDGQQAAEIAAILRASVPAGSGSVALQRIPTGLSRAIDRWGAPPPGFPLMRRIKATLDPAGLFSPGRLVGGL